MVKTQIRKTKKKNISESKIKQSMKMRIETLPTRQLQQKQKQLQNTEDSAQKITGHQQDGLINQRLDYNERHHKSDVCDNTQKKQTYQVENPKDQVKRNSNEYTVIQKFEGHGKQNIQHSVLEQQKNHRKENMQFDGITSRHVQQDQQKPIHSSQEELFGSQPQIYIYKSRKSTNQHRHSQNSSLKNQENKLYWDYKQVMLTTNMDIIRKSRDKKNETYNYLFKTQDTEIDLVELDKQLNQRQAIQSYLLKLSNPIEVEQASFFLEEDIYDIHLEKNERIVNKMGEIFDIFYDRSIKLYNIIKEDCNTISKLEDKLSKHKDDEKGLLRNILSLVNDVSQDQSIQADMNIVIQGQIQQVLSQFVYPYQFMKEFMQQRLNNTQVTELYRYKDNKKKETNSKRSSRNYNRISQNDENMNEEDSQQAQSKRILHIPKQIQQSSKAKKIPLHEDKILQRQRDNIQQLNYSFQQDNNKQDIQIQQMVEKLDHDLKLQQKQQPAQQVQHQVVQQQNQKSQIVQQIQQAEIRVEQQGDIGVEQQEVISIKRQDFDQLQQIQQWISINKCSKIDLQSQITYLNWNWSYLDNKTFPQVNRILVITSQQDQDSILKWVFYHGSLHLMEYAVFKYENKITFIYLNTLTQIGLNTQKLQDLSQQSICFYRSPSDKDINQILQSCEVIVNVQKRFNVKNQYLLNGVQSKYAQEVIACSNVMFIYDIEKEEDAYLFRKYFDNLSITHINSSNAKKNTFILQNNLKLFLYIHLKNKIDTVGLSGFKQIPYSKLRTCLSIIDDIQSEIQQILKVITKDVEFKDAKLIKNKVPYQQIKDHYEKYNSLNDIILKIHYQNEQPQQNQEIDQQLQQ